jgi:hypothetical protein
MARHRNHLVEWQYCRHAGDDQILDPACGYAFIVPGKETSMRKMTILVAFIALVALGGVGGGRFVQADEPVATPPTYHVPCASPEASPAASPAITATPAVATLEAQEAQQHELAEMNATPPATPGLFACASPEATPGT